MCLFHKHALREHAVDVLGDEAELWPFGRRLVRVGFQRQRAHQVGTLPEVGVFDIRLQTHVAAPKTYTGIVCV